VKTAGALIRDAVTSWSGVEALPHRFGGVEYRYGRKEMGHVHGDRLADLPLPRRIYDEVIASGRAQPHHVLPDTRLGQLLDERSRRRRGRHRAVSHAVRALPVGLSYDGFGSLPEDVQQRIRTVIEPADPVSWVQTPIPALEGKTFLDVINSADGKAAVADYFAKVEAFEHPSPKPKPGAEDLGHLLHFDSADLDSNRAGLISASQRSRLWRRDMLQLVGASACLIGGIVFNVGLFAGWFTARGKGAGLGVALMLLGVLIGFASTLLWLDLATGQVSTVQGQLQMVVTASRSGLVHSIQVGGLSFTVSVQVYDHSPATPMRVYYLRRSQTLLALEPAM